MAECPGKTGNPRKQLQCKYSLLITLSSTIFPYTLGLECSLANTHPAASRRSHLQRGVKTTSWEARKERDTKAAAIKALQNELKDEKAAELQRFVLL